MRYSSSRVELSPNTLIPPTPKPTLNIVKFLVEIESSRRHCKHKFRTWNCKPKLSATQYNRGEKMVMGMRKLLPFITRTLARLSEGRVNFDYVLPDFATPWKICLMSCTKLIVAMKSRARRSRNLPVPPPHPSRKSHRPQYQCGGTGGSWGG